jgi:glycogen synthase
MREATPKVAIVSRAMYPFHGFGGLENHVYYLAVHLNQLGVEVKVFLSLPPESIVLDEHAKHALNRIGDIPIYYTPYGLLPLRRNSVPDRITNYPAFACRQGAQVVDFAAQKNVNVIHAQGLSGFGCAVARRRSGVKVPLVTNPQGLEEFKVKDTGRRVAYSYFRAMYKYGARMSDRTIATDRSQPPEITRYLGIPGNRMVVLPNAVDIEDCLAPVNDGVQRRLRERWDLGSGPVLLNVGRLESNKGLDIAVEALAKAKPRLPDGWRWVLVGAGSQGDALRTAVDQAGISANVVFAGAIGDSDLHNLYEIADVFVHPTLYEGSSIVTLEAMAHGLPVVASRTGGIPDKVEDGANGFLFDPGDAEQLSSLVLECLADSDRARRMGQVGRERVDDEFAWPVVARNIVTLYKELLENYS